MSGIFAPIATIGVLIFYILAVSGLTAEIYTEQGIPTTALGLKDYSFTENSQTDFSQISALNQSNIKVLSGTWNLTGGNLVFTQNDYLLFIFPQYGKIAFTDLFGANNQTLVSNTYIISNPPGNKYEIVFLEGLDGGDKIKVIVDNTGFHLIEGGLIPFIMTTTDFPFSGANTIQNATITTEYHSDTKEIKLTFNNKVIFDQPTKYETSIPDIAVFAPLHNYYGGFNSENIGFSISRIEYQTTLNTNNGLDTAQLTSIMLNIIAWFGLPGLTDSWYGILINLLAVKLELIILIIYVALIVRSLLPIP